MKKVLLGMLFCGAAVTAFAQNSVKQVAPGSAGEYIADPSLKLVPATKGQREDKQGSKWYNWMDAANQNIGIEFTFYNNSSIFPDSSVKQIYGDGNGGTTLGSVGNFGEGIVFDPKAPVFADSALHTWHSYNWDSAMFFIQGYKRYPENPNADTIIVQFYTSAAPSSIVKNTFTSSGEKTAYVRYDYKKNLGSGEKSRFTYLLTDQDTGTGFHGILVPTTENGDGLNVPKDGLCALTISFRPGYSYSLGDTLDERSTPPPTKRLNHLKLAIGHDLSKTSDESYNNGLRVVNEVRYNKSTNGWNGLYIPGDAWNAYNEYLYTSFHINANFNLGMSDVDFTGYSMDGIYPNPLTGRGTINFSLGKAEHVNITIYNALGQPVQTVANGNFAQGPNSIGVETNSMRPGVYFYTIQAGSFAKTLKMTVAK
jgi:hypothetical protein